MVWPDSEIEAFEQALGALARERGLNPATLARQFPSAWPQLEGESIRDLVSSTRRFLLAYHAAVVVPVVAPVTTASPKKKSPWLWVGILAVASAAGIIGLVWSSTRRDD